MLTGYRRGLLPLLLCSAISTNQSASAADEPLYVKNTSPFAGLLGLPSQRAANTPAPGVASVALHAGVASHYVRDDSASEYLNLDGETRRVAIDLRYGVARGWDVQLEVPWLEHSGGDLDKLIDNWHDFWGMSDGGRTAVPRDLLDYQYANSTQDIALIQSGSGIGDVSLAISNAFYHEGDTVVSLALGYKFGTGDDDDFLGSGADDAYVAVRFSGRQLSDLPLTWHGQAGYLRAGDSELLGPAQQDDLWFAGLAMDWRVAQWLSLLLQVDAHAAPLDSGLTGVGKDAVLLSVGARWNIAPRWSLEASVIEDIRVETAPDVTFQASLRYHGG
tara:strand:- start:92657 stop:93652 length:996 start_codon:yes stop_codon:yes gene_type:complete